MKTTYLIPYRYRNAGWTLLVFGFTLLILMGISGNYSPEFADFRMFALIDQTVFGEPEFFVTTNANFARGGLAIAVILGLILIGFSREVDEDEYYTSMRLNSLAWAIYINFVLLILTIIFIHGMAFLTAVAISMFSVLILFVGRYEWEKLKMRRRLAHEEQG